MKVYFILMVFLFGVLFASAQKEENDNSFKGNKNKPERQEWLRDRICQSIPEL